LACEIEQKFENTINLARFGKNNKDEACGDVKTGHDVVTKLDGDLQRLLSIDI